MPDSLPPLNWGSAPFDERDLDAVLSGEMMDMPDALRPVADTLAALCAAGAAAELSGEAAIMAEFRALRPAETACPAPAPTLRSPVIPADRRGRRAAPRRRVAQRRRVARRPGKRRADTPVSRRARVLLGLGGAAVIVIAAVFAINLPGPFQRLAHLGHQSTASPSPTRPGSSPASPRLQATGAATDPARPAHSSRSAPSHSPSPSSSGPGSLCREFFGYSAPPAGQSSQVSLFKELSELAGSPYRIHRYCGPYLGDLVPHGGPDGGRHYPGTSPGNGGPGNGGSGYSGPGNGGPGNGGSGYSGSGYGGRGNGGPGYSGLGYGGPGSGGPGRRGNEAAAPGPGYGGQGH